MTSLEEILRQQFPDAVFDPGDPSLSVGSFPEWDSLGTFNLLLLVEETYGVRFSPEEMSELKSIVQIRTRLAERGIQA